MKSKKSGRPYNKKRKSAQPKPKQTRPDGTIRLNKAIAETGYCSRREADELVRLGRVSIDGKLAEMGTFIYKHQLIEIDGKPVNGRVKKVYLVLNKPEGIECTTDTNVPDNIIDFVGYPKRIFSIGRLDKGSEGLILLTNDGDIVNPILKHEGTHEKEYIVTINKPITDEFIQKMSSGVRILGQKTLPAKVKKLGEKTFSIILVQGLNRQIRRMCEALGCRVVTLKRVRIMHIEIGNLKTGTYRALTTRERDELFCALGMRD